MYRVRIEEKGKVDEFDFEDGKMIECRKKAIIFIEDTIKEKKTITRLDLYFCIDNERNGRCISAIKNKGGEYQIDETQKDLIVENMINEFKTYGDKKWTVAGISSVVLKSGEIRNILDIQFKSYELVK